MLDRIIGEAIGTFIFAFIISVADTSSEYSGNYAHPFSLGGGAIILMMLAGFSADPHLNPAITLGHFIRHLLYHGFQSIALIEHLLIILVQFVAAIPGAYLGWGLNVAMIYFGPTNQATDSQAFIAELVFTTLIVSVALMIGKTKDSRILGCVGLGATYMSGAMCVSYYSGACFNPALGFAVNIVKYSETGHHLKDTWIYIAAPAIGGIIGGIINSILIIGGTEEKEETTDIVLRGEFE